MDPILKDQYETDLELLRSCAVSAGIVALSYFRRNIQSWTKENASPVTEADFKVNQMLYNSLMGARPNYGWLSEESADNLERLTKEYIFVVDPIDGTRAFMRGDDCWSISLAIVKNGKPIAGVIYAPALDELYEASIGSGAYLNSKTLCKSQIKHHIKRKLPIISTLGAIDIELEDKGLEFERGTAFPSLAYRLVQVATGVLDVALARRGAQDWDIAASAVILEECGIEMIDVCCGKPIFNKQEIRHGALATMGDISLKPLIGETLRNIYGCPKLGKS